MKVLLNILVLLLTTGYASAQNPKRNPPAKTPPLPPAVIFAGTIDVSINGEEKYSSQNGTVSISDNYIVYNSKVVNNRTGEMKGDTIYFTGVSGMAIRNTIMSYQNSRYPMPAVDCDSLKKICYKNRFGTSGMAINIFWGDVYSSLTQKMIEVKGKNTTEVFDKTSSLLMTRGWVFDCTKGTAELQVFFQYMQSGNGGETSVRFSRTISTNVICH